MWDEPKVTINGVELTVGQSSTLRVAVEVFMASLQDPDGLGTDEHGQTMTRLYKERLNEIRGIIFKGR